MSKVIESKSGAQGCSLFMLLILSSFWVLGGSALVQLLTWSIEQAILEATYTINDVRWIIMLAYGGILIVALLIVTLWTRLSRMKAVFRTWMLAAILAVILAPARFVPVTIHQMTALYQIAGLILYILGLWVFLVRPAAGVGENESGWRGAGLALLVGALVGLPWVWLGALGSPLDTLLGLVVAGLFGIAASMLIVYSLQHSVMQENTPYSGIDYGMDGFAAGMTLLILVTAFGQNQIQWVLTMIVPAAGWAVVGLTMYGRGERPSSNWLPVAVLIGLVTAWPTMLVDPVELSVKITGTPGELIGWILRAGQYSLLLLLAAAVATGLLLRRQATTPSLARTFALPVAVTWLALIAVYFVWGQPGFYGDHIFIVMRQQADLSSATTIDDPTERRLYVYDRLVEHASATQAELQAELDRLNIGYTSFYLENGIEVHAGYLVGQWLAGRADVDRVLINPYLRPLPAPIVQSGGDVVQAVQVPWNLERIKAPQVWELGIRGQGIIVGHSDSGVQFDHPELADSYRGREDGHDFNWHDAWFNRPTPYDFGGHGTHTLAIAVGNHVGVAPDAEWIGCANMARNFGNPALYLDCLQYLFAPFPHGGDPFVDGRPELGAHVLNNSWGCPPVEGCDFEVLGPALSALRSAGVFTVVSAGNAGMAGCETISQPPALHAAAYAIGATDVQDQLAIFSSVGPVTIDDSGRLKPDLVAPGVEILSAFPGSSYARLSGTSMAAPHVTGTVTLMWSANPALIGKIDRTIEILSQTAGEYVGAYPECIIDVGHPNPAVGFGILDAAAAVQMALEE